MKFEIGKCYEHISGAKIHIVGEVNTSMYGNCLIGETVTGELLSFGRDEKNTMYSAVYWKECEDFAEGEVRNENRIASIFNNHGNSGWNSLCM